jgi:hypothetical protein
MAQDTAKMPTSSAIIPGVALRGVAAWNVTQNRVALAGVVLIIVLIFFPPWNATAPNGMTGSIGHYLVFSSTPADEYKYPGLDYGRLFLEIFGIALIATVGVFLARGSRDAA